MKRTQPAKKKAGLDPIEGRRDWILFAGHATMHVWASGGPIHDPHRAVLQLLIEPWMGDDESWTVYRHQAGAQKDGKIVFKKWDREADKARFRALGDKKAPKDWRSNSTSVTERQIPVSGRWVSMLERRLGSLRVPPIAGPVQPLSRNTTFRFRLWRSRQQSEFQWEATPPKSWQPLARLFYALLRSFRLHADGKPLARVQDL
jgi:hypothetical protein